MKKESSDVEIWTCPHNHQTPTEEHLNFGAPDKDSFLSLHHFIKSWNRFCLRIETASAAAQDLYYSINQDTEANIEAKGGTTQNSILKMLFDCVFNVLF